MEDLAIRRATSSDVGDLVDLRLSLQRHVEASNPWIWRITDEGEKRLRQELEKMLEDEEERTVVAKIGDKIVGFASGRVSHRVDYSPRSVGQISIIYVQETVRRRGVGSHLVQHLCRFFRSEGVEDVTLRYALGNREAESFWRGLGFEPIIVTANTHLKELEERLRESPVAEQA